MRMTILMYFICNKVSRVDIDKDPPFPWKPVILLTLLKAMTNAPFSGVLSLIPIFWEDHFGIGSTGFATYLTCAGVIGALTNYGFKKIITKFGIFNILFQVIIITGIAHIFVGFFHQRTIISFILHVFLLAFSIVTGALSVPINVLAGQYSHVCHRNFAMSVVSTGKLTINF